MVALRVASSIGCHRYLSCLHEMGQNAELHTRYLAGVLPYPGNQRQRIARFARRVSPHPTR